MENEIATVALLRTQRDGSLRCAGALGLGFGLDQTVLDLGFTIRGLGFRVRVVRRLRFRV